MDLRLAVKQLHAQLWQIDQERELLQNRYPVLESWYQIALARVESNTGSTSDVLQIQSLLNEIKNALDILERSEERRVGKACRLRGWRDAGRGRIEWMTVDE